MGDRVRKLFGWVPTIEEALPVVHVLVLEKQRVRSREWKRRNPEKVRAMRRAYKRRKNR